MQEPRRDDGLLRLHTIKRNWKAATQASSWSSNGHNKIQNSCPAKDKLCVTCSEKGHNSHDCPMKDREEKLICTICNKVGHYYLRCCRLNVSENHACHRCGEKGHYASKGPMHCGDKFIYTGLSCSSCDTNHLLGRCPMSNITCFLSEGKDCVPAQCHLSPILTAVNQHCRESFRGTLKEGRTVTRLDPPSGIELYDDSRECQLNGNNEMAPKVSSCSLGEPVNRDGGSPIKTHVLAADKNNPATTTDEPLTPASGFTCLDCHEDNCHSANSCSKKKSPRELEPYDCNHGCQSMGASEMVVPNVSSISPVVQDRCDWVSPIITKIPASEDTNAEAMTDVVQTKVLVVTCFSCHDEGHWARNCPKKAPRKLVHCGVTCLNCNGNHYTIRCPKKKKPGELKLCNVTCLRCRDKGHFADRCPKMQQPR
ncbi:hypothetical protein SETIT_2G146200v2 [Setaria italica]|uniref:CCHC-type domain-containing protein n=2 Tax=Setaria italica TaxID=4555 RepID=A0A368PYU6_SETIT|nr:uncharacterized protein LOC101778855 [Setaria italica]XP_022680477.1 uncharacterized protein LOC101778855 [Setaria italica]XP_022680478.1 uncharacterized protein LOC101778855 [Setaria italica]XP_022680479.1 uncharacterized protein LOC101778855 [Setaria italica]RCV10912.1 hypothetical protein SETIT_2G146200v2 [Setaria italica]RCV10913.1 hypothetical protein SETIT_2G146200v2 [Setaria italica]RCV10914.1 hypothetical protein SETIT_2G146200v2 [Setaria italica]RCV10915.1 hypothetical protein SE